MSKNDKAARKFKLKRHAKSQGIVIGRGQLAGSGFTSFTGTGDAGPSTEFVNLRGHLLRNVKVHLIFWGSFWGGSPTPTVAEITGAVTAMFASPYMEGLAQYGGIGNGSLNGFTLDTASDPPSPIFKDDPQLNNSDITAEIIRLLNRGQVPEPDDVAGDVLYCVILPPGTGVSNPIHHGAHSAFEFLDEPEFELNPNPWFTPYAWALIGGSLDNLMVTLSHEIVEACTDPFGNGWVAAPGTCPPGSWCEIGDVCKSAARINGVMVQSYWSQQDRACIIPGPRWRPNDLTNAVGGQLAAGDLPATCSTQRARSTSSSEA